MLSNKSLEFKEVYTNLISKSPFIKLFIDDQLLIDDDEIECMTRTEYEKTVNKILLPYFDKRVDRIEFTVCSFHHYSVKVYTVAK